MKIKELRKMDKTTMNSKVEELKKELMKLNAQVATGTVPENPGKIRSIKKTFARINTILNEKKEVKSK
ncbi:50S ribosomal protein L29 [Candidatus Woesearchaeota archaeon]|nr:50S ribosomal protein L29 [Candidatus Woesearchaeota archaeon]